MRRSKYGFLPRALFVPVTRWDTPESGYPREEWVTDRQRLMALFLQPVDSPQNQWFVRHLYGGRIIKCESRFAFMAERDMPEMMRRAIDLLTGRESYLVPNINSFLVADQWLNFRVIGGMVAEDLNTEEKYYFNLKYYFNSDWLCMREHIGAVLNGKYPVREK